MKRLPHPPLYSTFLTSLLVGAFLTVSSCNSPDAPSSQDTSESPQSSTEDVTDSTDVSAAPEPDSPDNEEQDSSGNRGASSPLLNQTLISSTGLGPAQLGMTLGELKQALGSDVEFSPLTPFIADFDAIAVQHSDEPDETLFYILHLAGSPLQDDDPIQGLLTDHPLFETNEGVGVGTPLSTAEVAYGTATLSYHAENESREYVRFENHPSPNISFGTQPRVLSGEASSDFAGIYADGSSQYNETGTYQSDAAIQAVLIVCLSPSCS